MRRFQGRGGGAAAARGVPRAALLLALGLAACSGGRSPVPSPSLPPVVRAPEPAPEAAAEERVDVVYPKGGCTSGWIEVEVFEPDSGWQPHPEHPRVRADETHAELSWRLLDLRVRCVDPSGRRAPSRWVRGVDLKPRKRRAGR